jgi:hypothetical protein
MPFVLGSTGVGFFPAIRISLKAGRILDLCARLWEGNPLHSSEFVISADEKTSIQARRRKQPTLAPAARPTDEGRARY